ncbi:hypothetical protein BH10PSE5_BH10PSE5_08930 [soil metagenome]
MLSMAAARLDLISVYAGTGQFVDWAARDGLGAWLGRAAAGSGLPVRRSQASSGKDPGDRG